MSQILAARAKIIAKVFGFYKAGCYLRDRGVSLECALWMLGLKR